MNNDRVNKLSFSRKRLALELNHSGVIRKEAEEGGCGVVGFCCSEPVAGKHIYEPSRQMHNRGNGKGGGIAAVGFVPEELGVSRAVLDSHYMLHIAFLDEKCQPEIERQFIDPFFEVAHSAQLDKVDDWKTVAGLEVKPPDVCRYFVRVKPTALDEFIAKNNFQSLDRSEAEDEFISQNAFGLNQQYYASLGEKKAFVLSYGHDIMILKVVGFAEAIVKYYKIEELKAHEWIAHQRFPTKGRVWHPGGAHPFAAVDMALVHNGDFANYHSVTEYLKQRNIFPQFLTDTEVSAQLFDLFSRTYHYPLEYIIEALAPTTEHDFDQLDPEKQKLYRDIQATHIHASPDGPWFFIIARNLVREKRMQLMGITDTAMLRPQVFAFCDGEVQVALICSEKQAIDATLQSMSKDDKRICPVADKYWNARGGSYTDGGSFIFNLDKNADGKVRISQTDKFGRPVSLPKGTDSCDFSREFSLPTEDEDELQELIGERFVPGNGEAIFTMIRDVIHEWTYDEFHFVCRQMVALARDPHKVSLTIEALTLLNDRHYGTGSKKRSHILHIIREGLKELFLHIPAIDEKDTSAGTTYRRIDFATRQSLRAPLAGETTLVIDAAGFAPEGEDCDATLLVDAFNKGWRRFISFNCIGQRFIGCGLGPETDDVTIDVYGSPGDYLASGIDGLSINVHGNAQDQLGQIIKRGRLVIHGDVGQTFMYGAKGARVFVLGNAAGRPLINSVGRPKVVINGTCLDFLGESFMAGDPHNGGGFVILNGMTFNDDGTLAALPHPYPGSNLFSLASGGAVFVRDPGKQLVDQQLNGGFYAKLTDEDWELIVPMLRENEEVFGITIEQLLMVDGEKRQPCEVYRKVLPGNASKVAIAETDDIEEAFEEGLDTVAELAVK